MTAPELRDRSVRTQIRYVNPEWRNSDEPPVIGTRETRRANTAYREMVVRDGRGDEESLDLETSGFELASFVDPFDSDGDRTSYRQQMLDLVRQRTSANETVMMADQIRTEDQSDFNFAYARFAHCDYHLANRETMALDLLARRGLESEPDATYVWYNTWQPFDHVVYQNALAMLDVRSLRPDDVIDYRYSGYAGEGNRGALVAAPVYNPDHRWFYYAEMEPTEVLLSKQADARPGHTRQVPHTSFVDPDQPEDVPPRRSIETRILAIFH